VIHARHFGQSISKDRYCEVRYETLVSETEPTLRDLFDFLQESWVTEVMNYDAFPHDIQGHYAETTRAFQDETTGPIYNTRVGKRIDPILAMILRFQSGRLLKDLGYWS
jgi:hypothetical protein